MSRAVALLRSAAFARAVLVYLAVFGGVGAWLPWVTDPARPAPGWATALGVDHPFSSAWFVGGVVALFASTLACTWGRRARIAAARRGELSRAVPLSRREGADVERFLRARGFRADGPVLRQNALALWGGWVLHVGLLALIAGIAVQQALHDGGNLELAVGEVATLSSPGAVFQRERGFLAPQAPPDLEVALVAFDPFLHQPGYAPDRRSRLRVRSAAGTIEADVDRAAGVDVGGIVLHQAIPAGLALALDVDGTPRALHLRGLDARTAAADVLGPAGEPTRIGVDTELGVDAREGTGAVRVWVERAGGRREVRAGEALPLGGGGARLVGVVRWAGFTYARSPGMPGVVAGFVLVLAGCVLLAFPAGVARVARPEENAAAFVQVARGADVLVAEWERGTAEL